MAGTAIEFFESLVYELRKLRKLRLQSAVELRRDDSTALDLASGEMCR